MITKTFHMINKMMVAGAYLLISFCTCCLSSCADMLETDSDLVEYDKHNTLNHPTDSVYSVLGIINKMQVIADRVILLGEVRGDLVNPTEAASADLKRLAAFDFSQDNKYNNVSDYYAVINNCNYYLANVDTAMHRRGRNLLMPEYAVVKTLRAWTYLQLAQIYGEVPLILQPVLTETEAREAMNQPRKNITDICNFFIADLTPYVGVSLPNFGTINSMDSQQFFYPMRVLLGDLCLWSGRYSEAANWYHDYLTDKRNPITIRISRSTWPNPTEFAEPNRGYNINNTEILTFIPMEQRVFDGVVSDLPNIFESTKENNYYFSLTPSANLRRISAEQVYCFAYNPTGTRVDTLYAPRTGYTNDLYLGDLRLATNYRLSSIGGKSEYSEYNADYQTISKIHSNSVSICRRTILYLRYAEALNRAGFPQSAVVVLKHGVCTDNFKTYVDSVEYKAAGPLIVFDDNVFTHDNALGIHSFGSGDTHANQHYSLPQPLQSLPTRQDTVDFQIPRVENMIITEMALEGAFEGYRLYDLMRVALRRNNPAYLADSIARRNGDVDPSLRSLLMNQKNWYLPLP